MMSDRAVFDSAPRAYPGDGRDGEHAEHGRGKVLEALEEIDEQGARAATGCVDDVVLVELLLAGEPQGDRHGDYNEYLINKPKESDQNHSAARDEKRSNNIVTHQRSQEGALEVRAGIAARRGFEPREPPDGCRQYGSTSSAASVKQQNTSVDE